MSQATILPDYRPASDAGSTQCAAAAFSDTEIQTMLERQRENLIEAANLLEAIFAQLSLTAAGTPRLAIVGKSFPVDSLQSQ